MTDCCVDIVYVVGQGIRGVFTIVDPTTGQPPLPPPVAIFAWCKSPSGIVTALTVTLVVAGTYTAAFTPSTGGPWKLWFSDSALYPVGSTMFAWKLFAVQPDPI